MSIFESKEERQIHLAKAIVAVISGLFGFYLLAQIDFLLAAGIFFLWWSNNLTKKD